MTPLKLLHFWRGGPIPDWRQELTNKLISMYPDAELVSNIIYGDHFGYACPASDRWRFEMCSTYERCLWVDNDIDLLEPLPLTDKAAMLNEYHTAHWSICWSGLHPEVFVHKQCHMIVRGFPSFMHEGKAELIPLSYVTHWSHNPDGSKAERRYGR